MTLSAFLLQTPLVVLALGDGRFWPVSPRLRGWCGFLFLVGYGVLGLAVVAPPGSP